MPPSMEPDLKAVVRLLAENRWPFRLHATYDETITRALSVYEEVNREVPFAGLHWFFDHCETISDRNIERIQAFGGGIAIQHRMAFQGEYFVNRLAPSKPSARRPFAGCWNWGCRSARARTQRASQATIRSSRSTGSSSGKTVGGAVLYPEKNRLERMEALRLYTVGKQLVLQRRRQERFDRLRPVGRLGRSCPPIIFRSLKSRSSNSNRC